MKNTRPNVFLGICVSAMIMLFLLSPLAGQGMVALGDDDGAIDDTDLITLKPLLAISEVAPGSSAHAALAVRIQPDWHINSSTPTEAWLIGAELTFDTLPGITPHHIVYPAGHIMTLAGMEMSVYDATTYVYFQLTVDKSVAPGTYELPLRFTYQPCNNMECRGPQTPEIIMPVIVGEGGLAMHTDIFDAAPTLAEAGSDAISDQHTAPASDIEKLIDKYGFWGYLLALGLAFVTGLLLSFSPCTYPMIPITVSVFAGQQRSLGRGFVLSLFYVSSMAVVYGIMGLIVSLVGGVFGAWLASPAVVIAISIVFVIFALSMFGLFELNVPLSLRQKLGGAKSGGGIFGAIVLGVIAALVVSPCVGPFVAGILLYVATYGSPLVGFLILFTFAIGLGTLYIIIGTFSNAIHALPNSGDWMDQVKRFFGFVLLLMALYFLRTIIPIEVNAILTGLLLMAFAVFGGGFDRLSPESGFFPRLKKLLGILAFIIGAYLIIGSIVLQGLLLPPAMGWLPAGGGMTASASEHKLIDWETDLTTGLERAAAEGKPVVIDTWATWCVNCKKLDKTVFSDPTVAAAMKQFVPIKLQLETADSPATQQFMSHFNLRHYSLPTVIVLDTSGDVHRIFQGVFKSEELLAQMGSAQL